MPVVGVLLLSLPLETCVIRASGTVGVAEPVWDTEGTGWPDGLDCAGTAEGNAAISAFMTVLLDRARAIPVAAADVLVDVSSVPAPPAAAVAVEEPVWDRTGEDPPDDVDCKAGVASIAAVNALMAALLDRVVSVPVPVDGVPDVSFASLSESVAVEGDVPCCPCPGVGTACAMATHA